MGEETRMKKLSFLTSCVPILAIPVIPSTSNAVEGIAACNGDTYKCEVTGSNLYGRFTFRNTQDNNTQVTVKIQCDGTSVSNYKCKVSINSSAGDIAYKTTGNCAEHVGKTQTPQVNLKALTNWQTSGYAVDKQSDYCLAFADKQEAYIPIRLDIPDPDRYGYLIYTQIGTSSAKITKWGLVDGTVEAGDPVYLAPPMTTLVTLTEFSVSRHGQYVNVAWETASEIDTVGFNLWRSNAKHRDYVQRGAHSLRGESRERRFLRVH